MTNETRRWLEKWIQQAESLVHDKQAKVESAQLDLSTARRNLEFLRAIYAELTDEEGL